MAGNWLVNPLTLLRRLIKRLPLIVLAVSTSFFGYADQPEVFTVQSKDVPQWFTLEAVVEAVNESTVSAQTSGRVKAVHYDVNDYVEQNTPILELVDTEQKAAVTQARAQLAKSIATHADAQSALTRAEALHKKGSLSQGELDNLTAKSKSAEAAVIASRALLDQAQEQLSYTIIHAPYSGIVKARHVEKGETVRVGQAVMTGLSLDQLRVTADAPQTLISHVLNNPSVRVTSSGMPLNSRNLVVFPYADESNHSFKIRVDIESRNANIFPGMWVKLMIATGTRSVMDIPKSALIQRGELSSVYVLKNNFPHLRQIRVGQQSGERVEVLSGLLENEKVLADGYLAMSQLEPQP